MSELRNCKLETMEFMTDCWERVYATTSGY